MHLRVGTRASALARWQAEWVAARLQEHGHSVELVPITTHGDRTQSDFGGINSPGAAIGELGSVGVFTKELQNALLDGRIDLAVHSLKDLPTEHVEGLIFAAAPERESVCDALLSRDGHTLEKLRRGAVIGTGSLRRRAQLLHLRPDLQMAPIRGNVDSRLKKLQEGQYDAIVLAEAGLRRLGLTAHITEVFSPERILPAVGQGALGIETRLEDTATRTALVPLDHIPTYHAVLAERSLLAMLLGGCLAPVGAWARQTSTGEWRLSATVLSEDGQQQIFAEGRADGADLGEIVVLGMQVAADLIRQGAHELIAASRGVQ